MNILQQCIYFPPEVGGLESHAFYLCKELVRLGDRVTMVTSRSKPEAAAEEMMDGVRVIRTWFPGKHPLGWIAHTMSRPRPTCRWRAAPTSCTRRLLLLRCRA